MRQVIYCGQIVIGSLTIRCKIAGVGVDAVVDTGASATIIRPVILDSSIDGWDDIRRLENHSLQLASAATAPIIGHGFVTLKLGSLKKRVKVWVAEVCDPCLIGLDLLTASECKINLARGIMQVGLEETPLGGVSMDEKVELEAPDPVTIPPSAEAIVPHDGRLTQPGGNPVAWSSSWCGNQTQD